MQDIIEDNIRRGIGRAAAAAGSWCDAYRPNGPHAPLAPANRFLRLPVIFSPPSGFAQPLGFGASAWTGLFDAQTTQVGDYLVRPSARGRGIDRGGIWFIAAQQELLPVLCIRTTRFVSFHRAPGPDAIGVNPYGGVLLSDMIPLASAWPASVLTSRGVGSDRADLPADTPPGDWVVLLPAMADIVPRQSDLMTDDLGRRGIVDSAERSDLGWRLQVRQSTT